MFDSILLPCQPSRSARSRTRHVTPLLLWAGASLVACSDPAETATPGTLRVLLEPEDTIVHGLAPGDGVEAIADGWKVTFDKYVLSVGRVAVDYATDRDVRVVDRDVHVVDLVQLPSNGETLWKLEGLKPGRWNLGFEFAATSSKAKRHETVAKADFERMVEAKLTHLITGTLTKEGGRSCPPPRLAAVGDDAESVGENASKHACYSNSRIEFEFAVPATAKLRNCELNGVSGVALAEGSTETAALTIHGDHLFFNGFPAGSEGGVRRLAQLWADADANVDGKIDVAEFGDALIADMAEWDERYQLGGAPPVAALSTLRDVVIAQLMTQGHMNGEGECEVLPAD